MNALSFKYRNINDYKTAMQYAESALELAQTLDYKNGINESALPIPVKTIEEHFQRVKNLGIDFDGVLDKQIADGLESFKDAFKEILESL